MNPNHLFLGTKKDNAIDSVRKGRWVDNRWTRGLPKPWVRGEKNGLAKLTVAKVEEARRKRQSTQTPIWVLAEQYKVSYATMWNLLHRKTWR